MAVMRLENDGTRTVLSPDEKYLYANAGQRMMRYEVKADGSLGPGTLLFRGRASATG